MAEGGFEELPLEPLPTDDHGDDGDGVDETEDTQPFEPGPTSTPYPEGEGEQMHNYATSRTERASQHIF